MVRRTIVLMFVVAMLALAPAAFAQGVAAAQLSGTVVDASGGALPGVEVTVTHTGTGAYPVPDHRRRRELHLYRTFRSVRTS